jgi:hypothetical protein
MPNNNLTQVSHPQFSEKPVQRSRPEKFRKLSGSGFPVQRSKLQMIFRWGERKAFEHRSYKNNC